LVFDLCPLQNIFGKGKRAREAWDPVAKGQADLPQVTFRGVGFDGADSLPMPTTFLRGSLNSRE